LRLSNHKLSSRVGLSVMLSSNIDQIEWPNSGTRLITTRMEKYISKGNVISENNINDKVFIFKIVFSNL